MLAKSKRTVFLLKIEIYMTIIIFGIFDLDEDFLEDFATLMAMACIPLINRVGALNVAKILERRESFANVSSFNDESYI